MLAEPRSRRGYTLVPKGKPLYEDETRFGTKLMQKMGWTKGSGLGRDESGSKDFLRVRYKNDAKGLGFEARDDQWTQHEQSFNGLLTTLNGKEEEENVSVSKANKVTSSESEDEAPRMGFGFQDTTEKEKVSPKVEKVVKLKEKISGISLEEKSKQSRARVHYQKFTRGKDLSQYSEKDLANIFGKRVDEESQKANSEQEEPAANDETINKESNVQFLSTGISVSDYFKMKMQAKRNQLEQGGKTNVPETSGCIENNSATDEVLQSEKVSKKKKKKKKEHKSEDAVNEEQLEQKVVRKKQKKSKKNEHKDLVNENAIENEKQFTHLEEDNTQEQKPKKNKKKSKNKIQEHLQQEEQLEIEQEHNVKGKKRKHGVLENEGKETTESIIEIGLTDEPQKKKQKKNKKDKYELKGDDKSIETDQPISSEKKKTKNKKQSGDHQEVSKVASKKDVSCKANDVHSKAANSQKLKLNDIEKLNKSYNFYRISSFSAEKFRNLNFNAFKGSNLSQIEGYSLNSDLQLEVYINKSDEERITNLWKGALDKYANLEKPKKTYRHYVQEVIKARKTKQKVPKLYIKTWKRKHAFQIV